VQLHGSSPAARNRRGRSPPGTSFRNTPPSRAARSIKAENAQHARTCPTFVKQALAGRPIPVHGDGTQSRCFIHVVDVVGALIKLMDHTDAIGQVFNMGSDEEVTIGELAERVKVQTASHSEIVRVPYCDAYEEGFEDMPRRVPALSRIGTLIGFRPTRTMEQILDDVIVYHRKSPSTNGSSPAHARAAAAAVAR
jgi:UDP-glucose 4-epimerase